MLKNCVRGFGPLRIGAGRTCICQSYCAHIVALFICLGGCGRQAYEQQARPASKTDPSTAAAHKAIDLLYGVYLARIEVHTTISQDGLLRSVQTYNKSYGPNDIDPNQERREVRQGQLTSEQMTELAARFRRWDSVSDKPFGGVPDGGNIRLRYGDKTVTGGSATPKHVLDLRDRICQIAAGMPVVEQ